MSMAYETSHSAEECLPSHRHNEAYAALVLDGDYDEISVEGRFSCVPGVLTIHPPWHQHADEFGKSGAVVLNLPVPYSDGLCSMKVTDAEAIARIARRCPVEASYAAMEEAEAVNPIAPAPWLVTLVTMLATNSSAGIADIAGQCGVSTEHAIRSCKRWFGQSPGALRREMRLQSAILLLKSGAKPASVAADTGFSDQPHLTRLLKSATGLTPGLMTAN